jgi:hypothetical protein
MAAPNIVNVTTISGKTAVAALGLSAASIVTNSSSSGQLYKINNIIVANYTATNISTTVTFVRSATSYYLAGIITVPAYSTLVILGKDTAIYLEEGDVIQASASATSSASITISYEIIS